MIRLLRLSDPPWTRLALAVLLGVAAAAATVGLLAGSGYVVDRAAFRPGLGAIAGILALVEVVAFLRAPLRYAERLVAHDAAFRSLTGWRVWLYDRLEPRVPAAFRTWRRGDLLSRAIEDVDTLQDLTLRLLVPVAVAVAAAALTVGVVAAVLPAAGLVLGVALVVALTVPPLLARAGQSGEHRSAARGAMAAEVVDLLQGAADLVAFGQHQAVLDRVAAADRELASLARRRARCVAGAAGIAALCAGGAVLGVLVVTVNAVHGHHLNPDLLAVLPLASVGAFEPVGAVALAAARTRDVAEAGARLLDLAAVPIPLGDPAEPATAPEGTPALVVEQVRMRYGADLPWVLDGVDLDLPPGGSVAVTGPSGAGKSTLVHGLLRFWPIEGGQINLAGVPTDTLAQADVRRRLALVDQDAQLFAGSIRDNVILGRPDATPAEVAQALGAAQLSGWVANLPSGLDTPVGESGARVSGGQRRRLALARALVAGGPILLLDEPTAGLEEELADQLIDDVLAAAGQRSVLLITHRPAEAARCAQWVALGPTEGAW